MRINKDNVAGEQNEWVYTRGWLIVKPGPGEMTAGVDDQGGGHTRAETETAEHASISM